LQIRFFHKVGSMKAPVTDNEKRVWSVLEAERQTIRFYNAIVNIF
jgi:peptide alpha-N-acetyltransferase